MWLSTQHQETNTVRANYTCCVPSPIPDERWFFYASLAKTSCCSTSIKILRSQEQRSLSYLSNVGVLGALEFINPTGDSFRAGRKCNFIPPAEYHMCSEQEKESSTIIFKTFRTNLIFSDAFHKHTMRNTISGLPGTSFLPKELKLKEKMEKESESRLS